MKPSTEPYLVVWPEPDAKTWNLWYPSKYERYHVNYFTTLCCVLWNRVIRLREVKIHE